jgi:sugar-specific transcriptional regulator TrmB
MSNSDIIFQAMSQLGMGNIEAEVYMAFLNDKKPNLTQLAKDMGVDRSFIYKAINKLKEVNLILENDGHYKIESPDKLMAILNYKIDSQKLVAKNLDSYLSALNSKYYALYEQPQFKIYTGRSQFIDAQNQILHEINTSLSYFGNIDAFYEVFDIRYQEMWAQRKERERFSVRLLIFESKQHRELNQKIKPPNVEIRVLPERFRNISSFTLYNQKVLLWDPIIPRVIKSENEVMFTTFSQIFELLWEFCEPESI